MKKHFKATVYKIMFLDMIVIH